MVLASQNEDVHRFKNLAEDATYVTKDMINDLYNQRPLELKICVSMQLSSHKSAKTIIPWNQQAIFSQCCP